MILDCKHDAAKADDFNCSSSGGQINLRNMFRQWTDDASLHEGKGESNKGISQKDHLEAELEWNFADVFGPFDE